MRLSLRPEVESFIDELVKTGRFPSPEAVVEAALQEMREVDTDLDDATVNAICRAEAQADRGEGIDLDTFRARMEQRMAGS